MQLRGPTYVILAVAPLFSARVAFACVTTRPVPSPVDLVRAADVIVRATAVAYQGTTTEKYGANLEPQTRIGFEVREVIRGSGVSDVIVLPGFLVEKDDFSDAPVPRTMVRWGGRTGNCYADDYQRGGQFLLFLRRASNGAYSARWSPLAPINEQLLGDDDPWLNWVRAESRK
jgi:hypothetical protein